jgi:flagellar hook-associated protein 1 FlgK
MTASIGSILSVARTALTANQAAIGVISHNLANATTEGYSRQRAEIVAGRPLMTPHGAVGTGVFLNDIARVRDGLLDVGYRDETSGAGYWGRRFSLLDQVEALHGDINTSGLNTALDDFWNSWSDLTNDPTDATARTLVRQAGEQVTLQIHRLSEGMDNVAGSMTLQLGYEVQEINRYATEIASLNRRIVAAEAGGATASDLRDARDLAVDRIAELASIQVVERSNGTVAVNIGGIGVVDGDDAVPLEITSTAGVWSLRSTRGATISPVGGAIGASMDVLNTDIPQAKAELDELARALVTSVNTLHRTGVNPLGQTDVLFFDDLGDIANVTADTLALSAAVKADVRAIAAGTGGVDPLTGDPVYNAGRNDISIALAGLREAPVASLGNRSIAHAYAAAVGRLGGEVRAAADSADTHQVLASQADVRRSAVSGVNIDEELVQLIRFQNAYSAAARIVTAADEMLQTILDMKR